MPLLDTFSSASKRATQALAVNLFGNSSGITASADGAVVIALFQGSNASQILKSTDYGQNWSFVYPLGSSFLFSGTPAVDISSDSAYQTIVASGNQIYNSSNFGVSFSAVGASANYQDVSISQDGAYQSAAVFGQNILKSSDFGQTWSAVGPSGKRWYNISISNSGQYQIASSTSGGVGVPSEAHLSSDFGSTWSFVRNSGAAGNCISGNGQYIGLFNATQTVFSSDFGATWTLKLNATAQEVSSGAFSLDGQYQTIAELAPFNSIYDYGYIRVSSDFGATWTAKLTKSNYNRKSVCMSSNGQYQYVLRGNEILKSSDFGGTWSQVF